MIKHIDGIPFVVLIDCNRRHVQEKYKAKTATSMTDLFEDVEFTSPRDALVEANHEVVVIGPEKGAAEVEIELGIDDANPSGFDALLIPGGYSPDKLREKNATSVKQAAVDVKIAGVNFIDQAVVIDDFGLISNRTPDDLPGFNEAIVNALK